VEMITEYVMSRSAILSNDGKRVGYGYLYIVISIIEGQRMIDTTWTCDLLLVSISYKTPVMNAMTRVKKGARGSPVN